jgi:hypothetical protein
VELPTDVDARCAARATREPKTMMHFFQKKDDDGVPDGVLDGAKPVGETRKRPAPAPVARGGKGKPKGSSGQQPTLAFAAVPVDLTGERKFSAGPSAAAADRQKCPICDLAFPGTWLNGDINAHIDECISSTVL